MQRLRQTTRRSKARRSHRDVARDVHAAWPSPPRTIVGWLEEIERAEVISALDAVVLRSMAASWHVEGW